MGILGEENMKCANRVTDFNNVVIQFPLTSTGVMLPHFYGFAKMSA